MHLPGMRGIFRPRMTVIHPLCLDARRPAAYPGRVLRGGLALLDIYVDADGCPVKDEVYRVAQRYDLRVFVVANAMLRVPTGGKVECVLVSGDFDAADDWIAERIETDDILISADLPLIARGLKKGARALGYKGKEHTPETIGDALASRALMEQLRQMGTMTGGPSPFAPQDRSRFLGRLDETIQSLRRRHKSLS